MWKTRFFEMIEFSTAALFTLPHACAFELEQVVLHHPSWPAGTPSQGGRSRIPRMRLFFLKRFHLDSSGCFVTEPGLDGEQRKRQEEN